ncbi:MAG: FGGY family carbohydrate kinase [Paludibacter sp.]
MKNNTSEYFVGIDLGTSSISGIIYDYVSKETASITKTNSATIKSENEWESLQDPDVIYSLAAEILQEFNAKYTGIKGIGFTGQMHGMLYVDSDGNAVSPLYTWQDNRGAQIYKDQKSYVDILSEQTNLKLATGFGLVTHFYNLITNNIPEKAHKLCTIMDYVAMRVTATIAPVIDYSNAASLGFFDKKLLCFDLKSLNKVGIDLSILPEIKPSASYIGKYSNEIPVYSAIGDNQAAFLGSVKDISNSIHITIGTSSQLSVYTSDFIEINGLDTRPFPGGGYILVGAGLCGGKSFSILKTFFEETLKLFTNAQMQETDLYKIMTSIDYTNKESNLPIVHTTFNGTRQKPLERGSITNISMSNFSPEYLILGFVDGICNEMFDFYKQLPEHIQHKSSIIIGSGNAIRNNQLLRKSIEKQFNMNLHIPTNMEEAAFGACICAVLGSGYSN